MNAKRLRDSVLGLWMALCIATAGLASACAEPEPATPATPEPAAEEVAAEPATSPGRVVLFAPSLFCDQDTSQQQLEALQGSGFTTVVFWTLRIGEDGSLRTCNRPAVTVDGKIADGINPEMPDYVQKLRGQGVETILYSIGAGGPPTPVDFIRAQNLLKTSEGTATLTQNLGVWADFLKVDGFDFDDEEPGVDEGGQIEPQTIATLTEILAPMGQKNLVTADPYGTPSEQFWLEALAEIEAKKGEQLMSWWNLQTYGNADVDSWIATMKSFGKPIGVSNVNDFFVAGYSASDSSPSDVCSALSQLDVGGGMLWNLEIVEQGSYTLADYSKAIRDGLAKSCDG